MLHVHPYRTTVLFSTLLFLSCSSNEQLPPVEIPKNCEMIFWEKQSWESGGGSERFTIWADGRSEIIVNPGPLMVRLYKMTPKEGWERQGNKFVNKKPFPIDVAKQKFHDALANGMHLLEPVKADYVDGGGTVVGVKIGGEVRTVTVAMFIDDDQSENHRRFDAVAKILDSFDTDAYTAKKKVVVAP